MNRSNAILFKLKIMFLLEGLETDKVEKWTFVVKEVKALLSEVSKLQKIDDQIGFRKMVSSIFDRFAKISILLDIGEVAPDMESLALKIRLSRPNKRTDVVKGRNFFLALSKKLKDELKSGNPSKSNLFLAIRLMNDIIQRAFINEKKIYKAAEKIQMTLDHSVIRKLYRKRVKPDF